MHAKTNRVNSNFQIAYFLAGSCHTADGAYALLCDLRADRADALANYEAAKLRQQAMRLRSERKIASDDEVEQLEGKADIAEIEAFAETTAKNVAAAMAEVAFIDRCIAELQPQRRFLDLSDPEAHEAAQAEEWKLELIHRAENYLLTVGQIPADQFATMRMHPDWRTEIMPAISEIAQLVGTPEGRQKLLTPNRRAFKLLEIEENEPPKLAVTRISRS